MGMGRGAEEVRVERGRLHLHPAFHHPSALRDRRGAAHHDEQPDGQGDGLRLVRSGGERAGIRTRPKVAAVTSEELLDACWHLDPARRGRGPHICAAVAHAADGICAVPGRLLQGAQRRALHRLQRRRRLRSLCARAGAPPRQAHPRQPDHRPQEHGGGRKPSPRQLALQCRCEGRHRARHHRPRHRVRSAARLQGAQFRADKFTWIGSANNEVSVCVAWKTSGVTGFEDTLSKELIVGGTGQAADTDQFPRILNGVLGTKFRIVTGYPGGNDVTLAMERGEVKGRCGWSWSSVLSTHKRWIEDKSIIVLVQLSLNKHPDLPDVPLVMDFAKTEDQQQMFKLIFARQVMGRPYLAPPDVPKDRAEALRKAFMDAMKDNEFLADAEKSQLEITPVDGAEVETLVKELYQTPKPLADKAAQFIRH